MLSQAFFLTIFAFWVQSQVKADCTPKYYELTGSQKITVNSPNYPPYGFTTPSSCQFTVSAPIYNEVVASCLIYIGDTNNCQARDSLRVQLDGTTNLEKSNILYRCGSNQVFQFVSAFNSMTIGHKSTEFSGFYQCNMTVRAQSKCDCGTKSTTRIVGGERAPLNKYPYMAVLLLNNNQVDTPYVTVKGGATIISTTAAVTAAHVFTSNGRTLQPSEMLLSAARDDLTKGVQNDTPYSTTYALSRIIIHPSYNEQYDANDIALVLTSQFIRFSRGVYPCCMPGLNEPVGQYDGQKVIEMGYGSTDYGNAYANVLKVATASMMPNSQCQQTYGNEVTAQDSCTYSTSRNDTCQGDSGGPVVLESYRDFFICIVKKGNLCGDGSPGMCQRVSPYRQWMEQQVGTVNYFCYYK